MVNKTHLKPLNITYYQGNQNQFDSEILSYSENSTFKKKRKKNTYIQNQLGAICVSGGCDEKRNSPFTAGRNVI